MVARQCGLAIGVLCLLGTVLSPREAPASFTAFEAGQVRPLALSPDGQRLYAVNTPDNRLEIFAVDSAGLRHLAAVPVGLEPVAVAVRSNAEVWVVNHLSDSVSIVDVATSPPRVVRTLLVGDEPNDIVFAGTGGNRAFIATARRGQNHIADHQFTTEGVGRCNVWVFDANTLGAPAGGAPIAVLTLFGDKPRALARNASGSRVYAAVFHSGNQTTSLPDPLVHSPLISPLGLGPLDPNENSDHVKAPFTGLIAKFTNNQWLDAGGQNWTMFVPFSLPDLDVFQINADATPPVQLASYPHIGTVLFNMAVNPANGKLYVTNGDAQNLTRFSGPGTFVASLGFPPPHTVRGNLLQYRITVIDPATSSVTPRHLNKHIDYLLDPDATEASGVKDDSLATPLDLVFRSDASRLYVAAFGSSKVGTFVPSALEANTFTPNEADQIEIAGGGPSGLVLDEARNRLYVLARFDDSISVVDVSSAPGVELDSVPLPHDPEPASILNGRPFLYDARLSSANGEASCSSCHVFGNLDSIAWDLGNPDGDVALNNNMQAITPLLTINNIASLISLGLLDPPEGFFLEHHPMKGPMLTQSLRGLANHGPMHWRGDRSGGTFREDPESLNEVKAFNAFSVAFPELLGRTAQVTTAQMQAFTDFMLQVVYPPNPIRNLDNSLTPAQADGQRLFHDPETDGAVQPNPSDVAFRCAECHTRNVVAAGGGFFGTNGESSFDGETQIFKVPHMRNIYDRIGMFGIVGVDGEPNTPGFQLPFNGDQIRGYGLLHDGIVDTAFSFVSAGAFTFPGDPGHPQPGDPVQGRRNVEQFLLAFDSNLAPIVGQQVSLDEAGAAVQLVNGDPSTTVNDRIDLLIARGAVSTPRPECDLVVKGVVAGEPRGWFMSANDVFVPDKFSEPNRNKAYLLGLGATSGQDLLWMCVPDGSGFRIGIDRDDDGIVDGSQCGDTNADGVVGPGEPELLRLALAGLSQPVFIGPKCNVIGAEDLGDSDGDGVPNDCTIQDWATMVRALAALGPGIAQVCNPA